MKLKIYSILAAALIMASCEKPAIEADAPAFDVIAEKTTYKAGESVTFIISGGEAQTISFYSGELLKDYASRTGRVADVAGAGATLSFVNAGVVSLITIVVTGDTPSLVATMLYITHSPGKAAKLAVV